MAPVTCVIAAAVLLPGCVLGVEPPGTPLRGESPAREEAPGAQPVECQKPGANCRWSPGYVHWDGGREVWVEGHWERANEAHDLVSNSQP